jgi:hypothetical protein
MEKETKFINLEQDFFVHQRVSIPAELTEAGGSTYRSEVHKQINSIWNREKFPKEWKRRSLHLCVRSVIKQTVVII